MEGEFVDLWTSETQDELDLLDTVFWHTDVNTSEVAWEYSVALFSNGSNVGASPAASTPFLTLSPDDNRLRLDINQVVPWGVEAYVVERALPSGAGFEVLDTVLTPFYVDSNLINGATYCYRVNTLGSYDDHHGVAASKLEPRSVWYPI